MEPKPPRAPRKQYPSKSRILENLIEQYKRETVSPNILVNDLFKYLSTFFVEQGKYDDYVGLKYELLENAKTPDQQYDLAYDLIAILQDIKHQKGIPAQFGFIQEKFRPILEEIQDDADAVTISDEDLDVLAGYVKEHMRGDEVKAGVMTKRESNVIRKLGVGGGKRKRKTRKGGRTRKTITSRKRRNTIQLSKSRKNKSRNKNKKT